MAAISRKKFIDVPIAVVVEHRARLSALLADEHGHTVDERRIDGAYVCRAADHCTWRITFASLAGVATWVIATFEPALPHLVDEHAGCRLARCLESFCSEIEAEHHASSAPAPTNTAPAPLIVRAAAQPAS